MTADRGGQFQGDVYFLDDRGDLSHPYKLVSSSALSEIGYDEPNRVLYLTFLVDGVTRLYGNVDLDMYEAIMDAPSKGAFFNERIWRNPIYPQLV